MPNTAARRLPEYEDDAYATPSVSRRSTGSAPRRLTPPPIPDDVGLPRTGALRCAEPTLRTRMLDRQERVVELLEAGLAPVAVAMILRNEDGLPTYYTLPHVRALAQKHAPKPRARQLPPPPKPRTPDM